LGELLQPEAASRRAAEKKAKQVIRANTGPRLR